MENPRAPLYIFHWHKDQKLLTVEASTLWANVPALEGSGFPQWLTIFNPVTKQQRQFRFVKKETDSEGDVVAWHYENHYEEPELKLKIWND